MMAAKLGGIPFFEVSAKSSVNVESAFLKITTDQIMAEAMSKQNP
jgi:hypothetical protein